MRPLQPVDGSPSEGEGNPSALERGFTLLGKVEIAMFLAIWTLFGLIAAGYALMSGIQHDRQRAMIERGQVQPTMFRVERIRDRSGNRNDTSGWLVVLSDDHGNKLYRITKSLQGVKAGDAVPCYQFGDDWFVPQFYNGGDFLAAGVFLIIGLLPLVGIAAFLTVKRMRASRITPENTLQILN
jgi:hypothetical protein